MTAEAIILGVRVTKHQTQRAPKLPQHFHMDPSPFGTAGFISRLIFLTLISMVLEPITMPPPQPWRPLTPHLFYVPSPHPQHLAEDAVHSTAQILFCVLGSVVG